MTPWIPTPSCYVTTENETCDNQTRRYESYRTPLLCPIHLENFHTVILTSDPRSSRGNGDTDALLLVRVTLWKLAWYNHNRRLADRSCTPLPRLLRGLVLRVVIGLAAEVSCSCGPGRLSRFSAAIPASLSPP